MDLSVTIVSYNTRDLTRQCLESIFANSPRIALEVCVVDNSSIDGSADMIEKEFPQVHLIRNDENKGLAAATNQGLEVGDGRYVLALNSDTVVKPEAFTRLVRFMDEHPEAGGATPRLVRADGGKHPTFCGTADNPGWAIMENLSAFSSRLRAAVVDIRFGVIDLSRTRETPCVLCGTSFLVRRKTYEQVGGQDPRFFIYGEDTDWSFRITKAGWKQYYVADSEVVHYGGQSTKQASVIMQVQEIKSRCRLIQKHFGLCAGYTLRLVIATMCGIRLAKWSILYLVCASVRPKARAVIRKMGAIVSASLTY